MVSCTVTTTTKRLKEFILSYDMMNACNAQYVFMRKVNESMLINVNTLLYLQIIAVTLCQ